MSKKVTALFILASIVVPLAAMAQQDAGAVDGKEIRTEDFVLRIPDTWSRLDNPNTILTLLSPDPPLGKSFRDNINVSKHPLAGVRDLDRILAAQERGAVGEGFEVIGSGVVRTAEPRIAWLAITPKRPEPGDAPLAKIDYLIINRDHLFVLHAMCETDDLDEHRPTFDAIARSVTFAHPSSAEQTSAPRTSRSRNPSDYEQGREVGRYTVYAMVVAVGLWLVFRLFKFFRK